MMVKVIWKTSRLDSYWRYSVTLSSVSRMNSRTSASTGRATKRIGVVVAAQLHHGADEVGVAGRDQRRRPLPDLLGQPVGQPRRDALAR